MATFPAKLLTLLGELDEESAGFVILNNLTGLTATNKSALRTLLQTKDVQLRRALSEFRTHLQPAVLLTTLQELVKSLAASPVLTGDPTALPASFSASQPPQEREVSQTVALKQIQGSNTSTVILRAQQHVPYQAAPEAEVEMTRRLIPVHEPDHARTQNETKAYTQATPTIPNNHNKAPIVNPPSRRRLDLTQNQEEAQTDPRCLVEVLELDVTNSIAVLRDAIELSPHANVEQLSELDFKDTIVVHDNSTLKLLTYDTQQSLSFDAPKPIQAPWARDSPLNVPHSPPLLEETRTRQDEKRCDKLMETEVYQQRPKAQSAASQEQAQLPKEPSMTCRYKEGPTAGLIFASACKECEVEREACFAEPLGQTEVRRPKETIEKTVLMRVGCPAEISHTKLQAAGISQLGSSCTVIQGAAASCGLKPWSPLKVQNYALGIEDIRESRQSTLQIANSRTFTSPSKAVPNTVPQSAKKDLQGPIENAKIQADCRSEENDRAKPHVDDTCPYQSDLNSTVQTEELFKKYLTERPLQRTHVSLLLEYSTNTLLRYIDCESLLKELTESAQSPHCQVSKEEFCTIIQRLACVQFGSTSYSYAKKVKELYDLLNEKAVPRLSVCEIAAALCFCCRGSREHKMRTILRCIQHHNTSMTLEELQGILGLLFYSVRSLVPNASKTVGISTEELSLLTARQCFEDLHTDPTKCVQAQEFVAWFSAQAASLAPTNQAFPLPAKIDCNPIPFLSPSSPPQMRTVQRAVGVLQPLNSKQAASPGLGRCQVPTASNSQNLPPLLPLQIGHSSKPAQAKSPEARGPACSPGLGNRLYNPYEGCGHEQLKALVSPRTTTKLQIASPTRHDCLPLQISSPNSGSRTPSNVLPRSDKQIQQLYV